MKKLWIFDLDGTILDTLETITDKVNSSLLKKQTRRLESKELMPLLGNGGRFLMTGVYQMLKLDADDFEEVFSDYQRGYSIDPVGLTKPFDGIVEFLEDLKSQGKKLAVISNKHDEAVKTLIAKLFRKDLFDLVLGENDQIRRKPNPDMVDYAMDILDIKKEEAVIVGDSEVDIETGKNSGINTIAVTWGFRKMEEIVLLNSDYICTNVEELSKLGGI